MPIEFFNAKKEIETPHKGQLTLAQVTLTASIVICAHLIALAFRYLALHH